MITRLMLSLAILLWAAAGVYAQTPKSGSEEEKAKEIAVTLDGKVEVWSVPSMISKRLGSIKAGDKLTVIGYRPHENFYTVRYKNKIGYVDARQVKQTDELSALIAETRSAAPDGAAQATGGPGIDELAAKRQVLTMLYGERSAERIMRGQTWVGMTKEMVLQSKGPPKSIRRVVFSNIIKEHWKFEDGADLYFENDILKAIGGVPPGLQPIEPPGVPPIG